MADACCDSLLDASRLQARQRRVLAIVLAINLATFAMMAYASWKADSVSLLSGSLDNLGDALTYALSLAVVGASLAAQSRVALVKGLLILGAAAGVATQVAWRLWHPATPLFETMGVAAAVNLGANAACLWLLTPYRRGDVNMASAWECSRNDIVEGCAVLLAAGAVFVLGSGWPDLAVAAGLLTLFTLSAVRVLRQALRGVRQADAKPAAGTARDLVCGCVVQAAPPTPSLHHAGTTYWFCATGCQAAFKAAPQRFIQG